QLARHASAMARKENMETPPPSHRNHFCPRRYHGRMRPANGKSAGLQSKRHCHRCSYGRTSCRCISL
ncbi:MAG: hypothetical protein ACYTEU_08520, partial [Planctomycetota bacterium]